MRKLSAVVFSLILAISVVFTVVHVFAQDATPTPTVDPARTDLENKIKEYQAKLDSLRQQKNSLASEIQYADTQIYLTQLNITATEQKIVDTQKEIEVLSSRIQGLDSSLNYLSKLMLTRVVDNYKRKNVTVFDLLLNSDNANDLTSKLKYYKTAEDNNQKLLLQVQETKVNFEDQKKIREDKKIQLDKLSSLLNDQKAALDTQKTQKQKLLADTNSDEATYQRLLSQAQAQLRGFGRFVASQGGASLLGNQTVCDDWGCYYNQRDSAWGGSSLNGTGYTLADSGCLLTSMAMVYTHYGHRGVNPQTINSNPSNFASYYPAFLNRTIVADGTTATRIGASIDDVLSSGNPVIVGISYDGGPLADHFIVLVSGSGGSYVMNDPYMENGHAVSFNNHYSVGSIVEIDRVSM